MEAEDSRRPISVDFLELRLQRMEDRMQKLEIDIITRMEAMTAAWQNLERAVNALSEKVVTRPEFDVVRVVAAITFIGLIGWIMLRLGVR